MILLGSAARTRTLESGIFWCPRERGNRRYQLRSVRRWARLGPVPIVPLAELGQFVECSSCASTFSSELRLERRPHVQAEDILTCVLRRAAGAVLATGESLSAEQRREAVIVLQHYASVPYSARDLDDDMAAAADHPLDPGLKPLAPSLNEHGRNAVIDATAQLARSIDDATSGHVDTLRAVAEELSLPCDRVRSEVADRLERALVAG